jgi:3-methyl-2-oxobutanoate hydroxymethyltransferase
VRQKVTLAVLQQMKRDAQKIVAVVIYDHQMARIVDRAGVDIMSVGDSVGVNLWGHATEQEVTLDEMTLVCKAVHRGATHALVSCDVPSSAVDCVAAARTLVTDGGADMVKVDAGAGTVQAIVEAGIAVWAQLGTEPQGMSAEDAVRQAKALEQAGASLLDFRHSGPVAGPAVAHAVSIPVIGGLGGGPWLDGRVRAVMNAIGYSAAALDDQADRYANVSRVVLDANRDLRRGRARRPAGQGQVGRVPPENL